MNCLAGFRGFAPLLAAAGALLAACGTFKQTATPEYAARFDFDAAGRHQRILGWGGTIPNLHWSGGEPPLYLDAATAVPVSVREQIARLAGDDLRMNIFLLPLEAASIEPQNDDSDPRSIRREGFDFSAVDPYLREFVLPLRERARASGLPFVLILRADTSFRHRAPRENFLRQNSEEYAEFALAALGHLRDFGLDADYWMLDRAAEQERDWTPSRLAQMTRDAGRRIREAGYTTKIAVPEASRPGLVAKWLGEVAGTPDAAAQLGLITYHSFDYDFTVEEEPPAAARRPVADWGRMLRVPIMQTGQATAGRRNPGRWSVGGIEQSLDMAEQVHADMVYGEAGGWASWKAFSVTARENEAGSGAPILVRRKDWEVVQPRAYWALRQYSRFVPAGSQRVEVVPERDRRDVRALGFVTPGGKPVVIVYNRRAAPVQVRIRNLPPLLFEMTVTSPAEKGASYAPIQVRAGAALLTWIPAQSIATFAAK